MSTALKPAWYSLKDHPLTRVALPAAPRPWLVAAVSLLISLCFLALLHRSFAIDESSDFAVHYEPAARNLLAGRGPLDANGNPETAYPPGFPVFLAATFWIAQLTGLPEPIAMATANVVGMTGSTLLVFLIGRRLWGSRGAWISSMAWASYPLALYFLAAPSSEIPFIVLMLGAFYVVSDAVLRREVAVWRAVFCGLLVGAAMLIRPIGIGLGVLLAAGLAFDPGSPRPARRLVLASALLLGNLLAVAPWETWAYLKTGSVLALSSQGAASLRDGLTFGVRSKGFRQGTWLPDDVRDVMQNVSDRYPELTTPGKVATVLGREFVEHPVGVVKLFALKAARSWYGTDSQRSEGPIAFIQSLYLLLVGTATVRAWRSGGVARRVAVVAWTVAGYFWVMTILVLPLTRYMVPGMCILFVLLPAWLLEANADES